MFFQLSCISSWILWNENEVAAFINRKFIRLPIIKVETNQAFPLLILEIDTSMKTSQQMNHFPIPHYSFSFTGVAYALNFSIHQKRTNLTTIILKTLPYNSTKFFKYLHNQSPNTSSHVTTYKSPFLPFAPWENPPRQVKIHIHYHHRKHLYTKS